MEPRSSDATVAIVNITPGVEEEVNVGGSPFEALPRLRREESELSTDDRNHDFGRASGVWDSDVLEMRFNSSALDVMTGKRVKLADDVSVFGGAGGAALELGAMSTTFVEKKAPRRFPFGISRETLWQSRWKGLAAAIVVVVLSIMFSVVGTQTFWAQTMMWQAWYTLFVIIVMLGALILELWDLSLTFFVANTALLLARVITLREALAGFSNEGILSTAIMFILAKALEKTKVLEFVVRHLLRNPKVRKEATFFSFFFH